MTAALDQVAERARRARAAAGVVSDVDRVLGLPVDDASAEIEAIAIAERAAARRPDLDDDASPADIAAAEAVAEAARRRAAELRAALVGPVTARFAVPGRAHVRPLRPEQAIALRDLLAAPAPRGTVVGMQVGGGKTLVGMLAPVALTPRPKRPLALVPAPLVRQWSAMHADWSRDYVLPTLAAYPAISHAELSNPRSSELLDRLRPDALIIDEAHAFRHLTAARTRRLVRYVVDNPGTRVVVMSGSFAADSLRDFAHLLELALREGAPIPLNDHLLAQWCACVDHRGEPERSDWSAIWPVVRAFRRTDPGPLRWDPPSSRIRLSDRTTFARTAYGRRLRSAPGVLLSTGSICRAALRVRLWRPRPPAAISRALADLGANWRLPDGAELVDALELDRHRRTLSRGYFNRWRWPDCPTCAGAGACDDCDGVGRVADLAWVEARRSWHATVRNVLDYQARPGFDSPALVERACVEGRAGPDLEGAWRAWQEHAHRWPPSGPPTERVWLPGARVWLASAVQTWLDRVAPRDDAGPTRGRPRGLVWYEYGGVEEVLAEAGYPMHGRGTDKPAPSSLSPALSRRVHGTGADGLHLSWSTSLVVEPPSSGQAWEQLIGRTHRPGGRFDLVRFDVFAPTWVGRAALEEAIARTSFMAEAGGLRSFAKLVICDFETPLDLDVETSPPEPQRGPSSGATPRASLGIGAALAAAHGGNK